MQKFYTASLSRIRDATAGRSSSGIRPGWMRIRASPAGGSGGAWERRTSRRPRGLVSSSTVAEHAELWEPAARSRAVDRFEERVVEIFYEGSEASRLDFEAVRDEALCFRGPTTAIGGCCCSVPPEPERPPLVRQLLGRTRRPSGSRRLRRRRQPSRTQNSSSPRRRSSRLSSRLSRARRSSTP